MKTLLLATFMTSVIMANAQEKPLPLYTNSIPGSKPTPASYTERNENGRIFNVSIPTITPYFPKKGTANGTAIIIFPGGGYARLSIEHEGDSIAKAFNSIGITAFVVKYRLPSDEIMTDKSIAPLQDAQQAILTVRKHAAAWGIKTDKVGIIGFSAGGHVASTEATHFDKAVIDNKDNINLRPDFMVLLYPVITMGPLAHTGSKENLLGKNASTAQTNEFSNELHVTANTPPAFIVQAEDDKSVPVQNSLMFYDALLAAKVKAELHIFEEGGHGFGLNNAKSKDKWLDWCKNWLDENGFL